MNLSKYRSKPLLWWLQTPLYAYRLFTAKFFPRFHFRGGESGVEKLVHEHFFQNKKQGVFIEVGAARPDFLSQGAFFRKKGWRVISVEPNPIFCEMHRKLGHEIYQYACGTEDVDGVEFSVVHNLQKGPVTSESLSSLRLKPEALDGGIPFKHEIEKIQVNLRRLDTIMAHHCPEIHSIDILSIDIELWELECLRGFDLTRFNPKVCIIENLRDDQEYRDYMSEQGYSVFQKIELNEVYVRV